MLLELVVSSTLDAACCGMFGESTSLTCGCIFGLAFGFPFGSGVGSNCGSGYVSVCWSGCASSSKFTVVLSTDTDLTLGCSGARIDAAFVLLGF